MSENDLFEKPLSPSPIPCPEIGEENTFLPFEEYDAFPTEPLGMTEALDMMNENLAYAIHKAHVFSRFSKEYFKACDDLLSTFNQFARGLVTLIQTDPGLYSERYNPQDYFRLMIGETSSQFLKCRDGSLESEKNFQIRDTLMGLQLKNFTFLQRLYATEKWAVKAIEKYADGFLEEKAKEFKEKEEVRKQSADGEPAPIRPARPVMSLRHKLMLITIQKHNDAIEKNKALTELSASAESTMKKDLSEGQKVEETTTNPELESPAAKKETSEPAGTAPISMEERFPVGIFGQPTESTAKNILQVKDKTDWEKSFSRMRQARDEAKQGALPDRFSDPPGQNTRRKRISAQEFFRQTGAFGDDEEDDDWNDENGWENLNS